MGARSRASSSNLATVVSWISVLWAAFLLDCCLRVFCHVNLAWYLGLRPREAWGLLGIFFAPFLHADWHHLLGNSIGLFILGLVSCGYGRHLTLLAMAYAGILSGSVAWLIGRSGTIHIGASGLLFGLIGFLLANGLFRRGWLAPVVALMVLLLFGAALGGMLPSARTGLLPVSWEMHLGGFIGGILASWALRRQPAH